jgi:DNA polymerase-3 subunit alpha
MQALPDALRCADQQARASAAGQNDMFGIDAIVETVAPARVSGVIEWNEHELLSNEKEALGLYLTGHPFHAVRQDARFFVDGRLADIGSEPPPQTGSERGYALSRREVTVAGLIVDVRKRGNRVTVVLDDDTGRLEVSLFSEAFQEFRHLLVKDQIVVVSGALRYDEFMAAWQVNAKNVLHIDRVIESRASGMLLRVSPNGHGPRLLTELHDVLLPFREGKCGVAVQYTGDDAAARFELGPQWSVRPSRELRDKLNDLLGQNSVRMLYAMDREMR